jgi:signal transduction histidine kinase
MDKQEEGAQLSVPELPANPRVLSRLLSALGDSQTTTASLARIILTDPALTLAVLRSVLAGAGEYDGSHGFSMEACVDALGRDLLQAFTLMRAARQVAAGLTEPSPGPLADIWRHSLICAEAAAGVARACNKPERQCYLAGLLCDIGALARHRTLERQAVAAPASDDWSLVGTETTVIVLAEVEGAWIGRGWLPPFVAHALRLRREDASALAEAPFVVRVLKVALALADGGASESACTLAKELLGLDQQQLAKIYEAALAATRELPVGLEGTQDLLGGGFETAPPVAPAARVARETAVELGEAVGEAAFRQMLYQALLTAGGGTALLERLRRAWRLLTRLEQHCFFLLDASGTALVGAPLSGDPPELAELTIRVESSRSLVAQSARTKRLVHAFGAPVTQKAAAVDWILGRTLATEGLLCVPLADKDRLQGVVVFGIAAPWTEERSAEDALLGRLASCAAAAMVQAEQARLQRERMRSALTAQFQALGKRVVHEASNPLTVVKNYLKVIGDKLGDSGQFRDELAIVNEELDRIAHIIQRMGQPLEPQIGEAARVDLNATVREVLALVSQTLAAGRNIEMQQQFDPQIPVLQADPVGIKQVILNLLTNAVEAMPGGGRLTVMTADNVSLGGEPFVLLQVTDSGTGMSPETMRRLFQPGFSTKGEGHEGIGLAVSESVVRALGGRILCRSQEGRGTIFIVMLPRRIPGAKNATGSAPSTHRP